MIIKKHLSSCLLLFYFSLLPSLLFFFPSGLFIFRTFLEAKYKGKILSIILTQGCLKMFIFEVGTGLYIYVMHYSLHISLTYIILFDSQNKFMRQEELEFQLSLLTQWFSLSIIPWLHHLCLLTHVSPAHFFKKIYFY